jgi:hypothetical protein
MVDGHMAAVQDVRSGDSRSENESDELGAIYTMSLRLSSLERLPRLCWRLVQLLLLTCCNSAL